MEKLRVYLEGQGALVSRSIIGIVALIIWLTGVISAKLSQP